MSNKLSEQWARFQVYGKTAIRVTSIKCISLSAPNYQLIHVFNKHRIILSSSLNMLQTMALGRVAKGYFGGGFPTC